MLFITLISFLISVGLVAGAIFTFKKKLSNSEGAEKSVLQEGIETKTKEFEKLISKVSEFCSKGQVENVGKQLEEVLAQTKLEKDNLKVIEKKLEEAQKNVDAKETHQQEIKSSKENEEELLIQLSADYEKLSQESVELEKQLAESLKYLDTISSEVQMTAEQEVYVKELANTMQSAGARLRELLSEYESVHERLEGLRQQHVDLEEEYTKLVEQQLGG